MKDIASNMKLDEEMKIFLNSQLIGPILFEGQTEFLPDNTYESLCPDCLHDHFRLNNIRQEEFPDKTISYKINNYGYRSDNFETDANKNFLFSGCSVTFGTGLPINQIWPSMLNHALKGNKFYNLAMNGASIKTCINDIYTYIRKFGKPKAIFLMLPNFGRNHNFGYWNNDKWKLFITMKDPKNINTIFYDFVSDIRALEDYLKALNVPFIWSTWAFELSKKIEDFNFNNYVSMQNKIDYGFPENIFKSKYWDRARDGLHYSASMHYHFYQVYLEKWKEKHER